MSLLNNRGTSTHTADNRGSHYSVKESRYVCCDNATCNYCSSDWKEKDL